MGEILIRNFILNMWRLKRDWEKCVSKLWLSHRWYQISMSSLLKLWAKMLPVLYIKRSTKILIFFFFCFLVPRLGVKPALHLQPTHSSQQHQILDQLSKDREGTCILMDTHWVHFCCATMGTPLNYF